MNNTDKDNNIPEKWRISCPLDHSTLEKFTNCDCNYGGARDVWWFKEQQIHSLKAELEKANNQKLNLLNDVRRVCYGIGINSPVRLRIQKMLDDFKDDESFLMNHNIQKFREVESLTKELEKARELMKELYRYYDHSKNPLPIEWFDKYKEFLKKEGANE